MFNAPQPRSRLYTKTDFYLKCAAGALLGVNYEGNGVSHLEQALVTMMPGQQVIAVPMCRVGIYLALKNTIRSGQKVILSPYTISDVVNDGAMRKRLGVPLFLPTSRRAVAAATSASREVSPNWSRKS